MAISGGADGEIRVEVTADADAAAKEVEDDLSRAVANAMKDPRVRAAVQALIREITKSTTALGKNSTKAFNDMTRAATKAANQIGQAFAKVGAQMQKSMQFNTGPGSQNVAALGQHVIALTNNFEELSRQSKETLRGIEEIGRSLRQDVRARAQAERDATTVAEAATRERNAIRQAEQNARLAAARVEVAQIRSTAQITAASMRRNLAIIQNVWRSATQIVQGFARAAATALRGIGRVVQGAFRGVGQIISRAFQSGTRATQAFVRTFNSAFRGIGSGVASAMARVSRIIRSALSRDEAAVRASVGRQNAARQRLQTARQGGLLGGIGAGGLAGGLGLGALLTSGFERAGAEESLQLQFATLLQDGEKATQILGKISDYARTTRFDFVEVAGSVAQLTAAFGDVDRAERTVRNLADIVSLTGGGTQQFSAARLAFSQIAASGRLEGQELNQLLESIPGVPLVSILADKFFGGDQAAFQEARRNGELGGKISADGFFDALEQGVQQRFPEVEGFAERVGTTLTGLAANLKENFAIFGSQIIGLIEGPLKQGMGALNTFFRNVGGFISGEIFEETPEQINPFRELIGQGLGFNIPFEELPPEMQDILEERNGWGPNEGFVLAASHAAQLWDELHPPPGVNKNLETLRKIRDIVGRMAKSIGVVLGLAAAFKVLQLSLIALASPLSLLVLATAGISGAFSLFYENSEKFRASWDGMWAAIAPTGEAIGGLIRSVRDAFSGRGGGEGPSILQRLGEAFDFIPGAARRALEAIQSFANTLSSLVSGQGFTDFASSLDKAFSAGLGALLGDSPEAEAQQKRAADRGGSNTLNLLEETFLGPVVRFFRGPFADVVERIAGGFADFGGFLGDIFTAIFGDGPGGVGTRVLDVLEGTFLGPVITFFRDLDFGQLLTNIRDFFAPAVELIGSVISDVWEVLEPIAQPVIDKIGEIIDAFKNFDFGDFDLGNIAAGAAVGATIGGIFAGIPGLLIGAVAGGLSQTGLFGAVVESINNAWEAEIKPALLNLWAKMLGFFADTFKPENLAAYAGFIMEFLRDAGRLVANIATDPVFVGAIAGIVAAAGLVVTFFTLGLVEGLAESIIQWTELISTALETAWDAITPDFSEVPILGPLIDVIGDALGSPIAGAITLVGGAILGKVIVTSVIAGITQVGPALISGAGGLAGMIFGSKTGARGSKVFDQDAKTAPFKTLGAKIAGSLAAGFLTFKFGEAAGASGSDGAILLSLLTGGATGAALGFTIGGPFGAAIGALAGTVVAGLGAAFGSAGARAREFNDEVARLADLLAEVPVGQFGGLDEAGSIRVISADIVSQFQEAAADAGADWAPTFIENFDSDALAADITDGIGSADSAITDVLRNLGDEVAGVTDLTSEQWAGMVDDLLAEADRLDTGVLQVLAAGQLPPGMEEALDAAGLSVEDLIAAWDLLDPAIRAAGDAWDEANIQQQLEELDPSAIDTVTEAVEGLEGILDSVDLGTGEQLGAIQDLLAGADLTVDEKFDALAEAADNATRALDEAKTALQDFFREQIAPENVEDVLRGFRLDLPDIGAQVRSQLEGEEGIVVPADVQIDIKAEAVADFRQQVIDGLGTVDNAAEFDAFVEGLTSAINTAVDRGELDPDLGGKFLEVVEQVDEAGLSEAGQSLFDAILAAEVDQATVDTATQSLADAIGLSAQSQAEGLRGVGRQFDTEIALGMTDNKDVVTNAVSLVLGTRSELTDALLGGGGRGRGPGYIAGERITEDMGSAISDTGNVVRSAAVDVGEEAGDGIAEGGGSAVAAARAIAIAVTVQFVSLSTAMFNLGSNAGAALARGLISQVRAAATAAAIVATAVVTAARNALRISSPSKVFVDIGKQVGQGFIQGIKDSEGDMAEALGSSMERAVRLGAERATVALERADVARGIFDLLQPSTLPGGPSLTDQRLIRLDLTQAFGDFRAGQRDALASAFGATPAAAQIGNAIREMQAITTDIGSHFNDVRTSIREAQAAKKEIDEFNRIAAKSAASRTEAEKKIFEGGRPTALTLEQRRLLISPAGSLDARNIIGQGNIEAITSAIETIRKYGETAISQGQPLNVVIANMARYRNQLESQAKAAGVSASSLAALFQQFGITNTQLYNLNRTVTSLNQGTVQGAANVQNFIDIASQVREFGAQMIEAGAPTAAVVTQLKNYRNSLVNQAVAMGFNRTELNKLINELGLSDTALSNFLKQLAAFDAEAKKAAATAKKAAQEAAAREAEEKRKEAEEKAKADAPESREGDVPLPRVSELHVHIPSGDPEAVALVTANRLAYQDLTAW